MKNITIIIIVKDRDTEEVLAKREAFSFESVEENLGKLQRDIEKNYTYDK